jgi:serine/threonine protein kinase
MVAFDHPNLVRLIGVGIQRRPWLAVLEFMRFGDLAAVFRSCTEYNLELLPLEQLRMLVQVFFYLCFFFY